jgi:hypothetical protein
MASTIAAGTTSGTAIAIAGDTSGVLQLQTNGTTAAVTINTSQNVGIGTASPTGKLNVHGGAGNSKVKLSNTLSGNGNGDGFDLDFTGTDIYITNRENGFMAFENNGAERMRLPAAGGVQAVTTISVGNATPAASGAGITFPASQSASSDANTLDDYEEGTWTPVVGGTATYTAQNGTYTKIGRFVSLNAILTINLIGTGSQTRISGLPYAVAINGQGGIGYFGSIATSLVFIQPYCDTNSSSSVNFRTLTAGATSMGDANIFQNSTRIDFTVTYFTS